MKPCFSWLCILHLDYFMSIRIQALIKIFPMVWAVIKSLVHEKSLMASNTVLFLTHLLLWGGRRGPFGVPVLYLTILRPRASGTLYLCNIHSPNLNLLANISVSHKRE